jgi:hypothetical protein
MILLRYPCYAITGLLIVLQASCSKRLKAPPHFEKGAIAGCVYHPDLGAIKGTFVFVRNSEMGTTTGKNGKFLILDVPTGKYDLQASVIGYHEQPVLNVRVYPDSLSIVFFRMTYSALPIGIIPYDWTKTDSTVVSLHWFIATGQLFDMDCK